MTQLLEYTTKHYSAANDENMKVLRRRLVQAGIYDPRAVAFFFIARTALAVGLAFMMFVFGPLVIAKGSSMFWLMVIAGGIAGYVAPSIYIDRRIAARKHRASLRIPGLHGSAGGLRGFRSVRWRRRWSGSGANSATRYPSLTANIHMTNLEIRAGKNVKDALERFAERLALEEARSFATLINQSIDLGS